MLEHAALIIVGKFLISFTLVLICERNQHQPYFYKTEIFLGSIVIAAVPLLGQVVMYIATAYMLRKYPYGIVRAWLWPIELYRSLVKSFSHRYPFRKRRG